MKLLGWRKKSEELEARPTQSRRVVASEQRTNTFRYYRQSDPDPETKHGQELIKRQRRLAITKAIRGKRGMVVFGCILLIVVWAGNISHVVVGTIVDNRVGQADAQDVRSVQTIVSSGGLRNHYMLTLDERSVTSRIRDKRPDILAVRYSFSPFRGTLNVDLVQSPTVLIVQNKDNYAFLNLDGVVSQVKHEAPSTYELNVYPLLVDDSSLSMESGKVYIPKDIVVFIRDVEKAAKGKTLEKHAYSLPTVPREIRVKFVDVPYYIKLSTMQPARDQLQAIVDIRSYLKKSSMTPTEYVDLRVPEKAYYR